MEALVRPMEYSAAGGRPAAGAAEASRLLVTLTGALTNALTRGRGLAAASLLIGTGDNCGVLFDNAEAGSRVGDWCLLDEALPGKEYGIMPAAAASAMEGVGSRALVLLLPPRAIAGSGRFCCWTGPRPGLGSSSREALL